MLKLPLISIIIPCRNEEKFISKCLESVLENDYPKDKIEIFIVDGMSQDKTREIVGAYIKKYPFIKLLDNPKFIVATALNTGIKEAKGDLIIRLDAHATYEKSYISKCVSYLQAYNADNIGGILKTTPTKKSLIGRAIALSLASVFGVGDSAFRRGSKSLLEVDTVFGGCYKREVFDKIGLFNENMERSQDIELNLRLKKTGGKILLVPEIIAYYYPKSNLVDFFRHNIKDGIWAIYPLKFVKAPLKLRHYIPLIFVATLPLSIWPYILVSLYFSFKISLEEKDFKLFFVLPIVFFARHFAYGVGSVVGLVKLLINK